MIGRIARILSCLSIGLLLAAPLAAQEPPAQIRVANYSPDSPVLEVYIDGQPSGIQSMKFNEISGWVQIAPGRREIAFVPQGSTIENALVGPFTVNLPPGSWSTLPVLGLVGSGNVYAVLISENYPSPIPEGMARVTVFNGIPGAPTIDVLHSDGRVLASRIAFGRSANIDLPAGTHALRLAPTSNHNTGFNTGNVNFNAATYYLLGAIRREAGGGLVLRAITQEQVSGLLAGQPQATFPTATPFVDQPTAAPTRPPTQVAQQATSSAPTPVPATAAPTPSGPQSIAELIAGDPRLGAMNRIIGALNLTDMLNRRGPFTVFAPTDQAFQNLLETNREALPDGRTLRIVIQYHIVTDRIPASQIFDQMTLFTLQGPPIRFQVRNGTIRINDRANVVTSEIRATNGYLYVIDDVLLPDPALVPTPLAAG